MQLNSNQHRVNHFIIHQLINELEFILNHQKLLHNYLLLIYLLNLNFLNKKNQQFNQYM